MLEPRENPLPPQVFSTTHWSIVLNAADSRSPGTERAMEQLCRGYWQPLYVFVRRQGYTTHDAQDSTQGFFAWLIGQKQLRIADSERGRFRSFLLSRFKHFLSDERKRDRAQKRGGGRELFSLDAESAEEHDRLEPATDLTPEKIFERRWAQTIMERTVARLRADYVVAGQSELFGQLKKFQSGEDEGTSYAEVAARLGMTESAVKSAIYRLRQRHRALLRDEVFRTVASSAEIDEEIRYLISVLGG